MYHGKLVEEGRTKDIFAHPEHEYTKALLAAVPNTGSTNRKTER